MPKLYVVACVFKTHKGKPWINGLAIGPEPDNNFTSFIKPDGTVWGGKLWDYRLAPYQGHVSFEVEQEVSQP